MQRNAFAADRRFVAPAIAVALLILAIGMLLSGGKPTNAASDTETQGISADILSSIEWNPATCANAALTMPAQSFSVAAGGTESTTVPSVGCVSSNENWSVTAQMTTPPSDTGTPIPASAFRIQRLNTGDATALLESLLSIGGTPASTLVANGSACTGTTCALNTAQTIVNNATANTLTVGGVPVVGSISLLGGIFAWNYTLTAPPDQPAGNYIGGVVTLTAIN